ncbi:MAG: NrpR transcriptional repressor [Candidatus Bathyarchaeum sp.]|nr:MAG: NrpR transcriptional repressor [Candidatus Bathyarchaeum sp.]
MSQGNDSARKEIEILRILSEFDGPVGSTLLKRELRKRGFLLSERTVRYHLQLLEAKGFLAGHNRRGRTITSQGMEELGRALASQRLGFVTTRFMSLAYSATYDPTKDTGTVVANVSLLDKSLKDKTVETMKALQSMNLLSAPYIKVLDENTEYCDISVPEGKIGLFTVCNLTLDSILIHSGIPLVFGYGGLVQVVNRKPIRFVEIMSYEGTTIPPLEVFVYRKMTSIMRVLKTGSGMLLATMREIPAEARSQTVKILESQQKKGWGGVLVVGEPNEPVLGVPVSMDRFGICLVGGIVPGAAMVEEGAQIVTTAPHCFVPIEEMIRI